MKNTMIAISLSMILVSTLYAQTTPQNVSMIQLVANPEKYDGKFVQIMGFLRLEEEGDGLYLHREDYEKSLYKNGVWVHVAYTAENKKCNMKYVLIEGTFDMKDKGHGGLWSGAIKDIKRIDLWGSDREKTEGEIERHEDVSWGRAVNGFQAGIAVTKGQADHQVAVFLKNVGDKPVEVNTFPLGSSALSLSVYRSKNADGEDYIRQLPPPMPPPPEMEKEFIKKLGAGAFLRFEPRLGWYDFAPGLIKPGRYWVEFRYNGEIKSPRIEIEMVEPNNDK